MYILLHLLLFTADTDAMLVLDFMFLFHFRIGSKFAVQLLPIKPTFGSKLIVWETSNTCSDTTLQQDRWSFVCLL